ncbi:unnamed protein product [Hanseniaspora opuntiae]
MDSGNNKCKMPRQFQHHIITDLDKQNYENVLPFVQTSFAAENQDVLIQSKVYKNFKCPKSACLEEELQSVRVKNNKNKQEKMCNKINEIILKDFKEFEREERKKSSKSNNVEILQTLVVPKKNKQVHKRNVRGDREHGITTSLKNKTPIQHSIDIDSTLMIDCIQKRHINRDMLKYVRVRLMPLPLRMFVDFKRDHTDARYFLQCGICYRYMQSGTRENTSFGKYFREHLMDNQCAYFHEPCYVLGY